MNPFKPGDLIVPKQNFDYLRFGISSNDVEFSTCSWPKKVLGIRVGTDDLYIEGLDRTYSYKRFELHYYEEVL